MDNKLERLLEKMNIGGEHEHDALVVLTNEKTGKTRHIWGRNIVTTAGNVYYAQKATGATPTNAFSYLYLSTAGPSTPAVTDTYASFNSGQTAGKAVDGTYPMVPDTDSDNIGLGTTVASWRHSYTTGDGPYTSIQWSFISKVSASGTDPILNSYKWGSAWSKDSSTSAKVFTNHTFLGS